ncbi:MAG: hypothetical protein WBP13_03145 [Methylophilaceae bacterium]
MIILIILLIGTIFSLIGGMLIWFSDADAIIILGALFLLAGLAILGFGTYANYSSCIFYYEQSLLKQYGKNVEGIVTDKIKDEHPEKASVQDDDDNGVVDTNLSIQYRFVQLGQTYESESFISDLALFEAIEIGMKIPVIALKDHPNISRLQAKKLKQQLNLTVKNITPENVSISEPLMEED